MRMINIDNKNDGKKLNTVLLKEFPALNINSIYKALRKKDIRVNDIRVSENITVHSGDIIKVFITDDILFGNNSNMNFNLCDSNLKSTNTTNKTDISISLNNKNTHNFNITTVYEDKNIIVVNKPTGIEVTGDNSLTTVITKQYGYSIMPCHRLDRNTSGLTIFAKNRQALDILFDKFRNHEIEKHYICRIYGIPKEKHKILKAYLFKDNKKSVVYISDVPKKGYQNIVTEYSVLSANKSDNTSILEVILHTGRTHQIRAHLAHIGYPIIGDGKYGINEVNKKFKSKTQNLCSYLIRFKFNSDSGILNYLNGMEIKLNDEKNLIKTWE